MSRRSSGPWTGAKRSRGRSTARQLISAAFNYAMRKDTYGLATNPATATSKRREPPPAVRDCCEPDDLEILAQGPEGGLHRKAGTAAIGGEELATRRREDHQDAELYRS